MAVKYHNIFMKWTSWLVFLGHQWCYENPSCPTSAAAFNEGRFITPFDRTIVILSSLLSTRQILQVFWLALNRILELEIKIRSRKLNIMDLYHLFTRKKICNIFWRLFWWSLSTNMSGEATGKNKGQTFLKHIKE